MRTKRNTTDARFIGFDLSLASTGAAAAAATGHLEATTFRGKLRGVERLSDLRTRVIKFVLDARGRGTALVSLEGYAFGAIGQLASLGELGGVIRVALFQAGIPFIVVAPGTLKKFTTGSGNAQKDAMMLEVFKRWGFTARNNDEADAVALAAFAAAFSGQAWWPVPKWQADVVAGFRAKMEKPV